jgi:hypothetical protein
MAATLEHGQFMSYRRGGEITAAQIADRGGGGSAESSFARNTESHGSVTSSAAWLAAPAAGHTAAHRSRRVTSLPAGARPVVAAGLRSGRARIAPPVTVNWGAVKLRLPGVDPYPVLHVGQVCQGRFPGGDCGAQGVQKCSRQDWIVVGELGKQHTVGMCITVRVRPGSASPGAAGH